MALPTGVFLDLNVGATSGLVDGSAIAALTIPGHPNAVQATVAKQPLAASVTNNGHTFWAADFDGTDDSMSLTGTALNAFRNVGGMTVVMVSVQDVAPTAVEQQVLAYTTAASGSTRRWSYGHGSGGQVVSGRRLDADASDTFRQAAAPIVGQWQARLAAMNYTGATAELYRDGTLVGSDATWLTPGSLPDTASLAAYIGSLSTTQYLNGKVARILVWQRVLTTQERADLANVIQDTYGITMADYQVTSGNAGPDQTGKRPGETVVLQGTGAGSWTHTSSSVAGVVIPLTTTGVAGQATFDWPYLAVDSVQTFTFGSDTMTVSGVKTSRRMRRADGTWSPVRRRVVEQGDVALNPAPDDTTLLAVSNPVGFQKPGTRIARLEWGDPNIPAAAKYAVSESLFGGLNITVTTLFRESGQLATGDYLYHVAPMTAAGAVGPAVDIPVTIVSTAGPTVTSDAPVVGTRTFSVQHTAISPASTIVGELRLSADSTAPVVASFNLISAATAGPVTESYTGLTPSTQYWRSTKFTRPDTGNVTVQASTFTTGAVTATVHYERLGPVLAADTSPLPAAWSDWAKHRILSQTTMATTPAGSSVEGPTKGLGGSMDFAAGTNNLVIGPRNIAMQHLGGITFGGGHHLAVRNIEIDHKWGTAPNVTTGGMISKENYYGLNMPPVGTTIHNQSARKGMQFNQQTGDVEGEGLYVHGEALNDAIWPNAALTTITTRKRYYTFQNCHFGVARQPNRYAQTGIVDPGDGNPYGATVDWSQDELHADSMQIMGNGTNTVLRLWQCRFDTAYQGLMDNMGDGVELEMSDVLVNAVYLNATDTAQHIGYAFFFGGPLRIGANVVVRNPVRINGLGQQRQVGYPEDPARWAGITQVVTSTAANPSWQAAWTANPPGKAYVVA